MGEVRDASGNVVGRTVEHSFARASGSFVADGFRVGQAIRFSAAPPPWYSFRALQVWWERRVLGVLRRRHGSYTITSVGPCVLKVGP